jgi:hypothetical protein
VKRGKEISFNSNGSRSPDFNYSIKGKMISITNLQLGERSFTQEIKKVLRRIEHYHQGSIASFRILYPDSEGMGGELKWDGQNAEVLYPKD